ncbi:MAG: type IV secretion system protein VirB6, partial [Candidatus Midichloriaceae bacterium]
TVVKDDKFNITFVGGVSDNTLFLCGKKRIKVVPIFNSTEGSSLDSWFKFKWKNKNSHRYLSTLTDPDFDKLKTVAGAKAAWQNIINTEDTATKEQGWGARNPSYFDTGIYIKNKDILSISWKGDYSYMNEAGYRVNDASIATDRQGLITKCIWKNGVDSAQPTSSRQVSCKDLWYNNSHIKLMNPNGGNSGNVNSPGYSVPSSISILGEEYRKGGIDGFGLTVQASDLSKIQKESGIAKSKSPPNIYLGLGGNVTDIDMEKINYSGEVTVGKNKISCICTAKDSSGCINVHGNQDGTNHGNYNCINTNAFKAGLGQYSLNGKFDAPDFSQRKKLYLSHFDKQTSDISQYKGWYTDNTGGYDLDLEWKGCPKSKGEDIQYIVADPDSTPGDTAAWKDLQLPDYKDGILTINSVSDSCTLSGKCVIFLRIKLETSPDTNNQDLTEQFEYYNTFGQYYVKLFKQEKKLSCNGKGGFFYEMLKGMRDVLAGTADPLNYKLDIASEGYLTNAKQVGVVGTIFFGYIKQISKLVQIILLLHLVFSAISYMLGVMKHDVDTFIKFIFKIAIVIALIDQRSWEFFGSYLVPLFIDGIATLISLFVADSLLFLGQSSCRGEILSDPYAVFSLFDQNLSLMFSSDTFKRIWAIMTNGLLGFFTGVMVIFSFVFYAVAVVQAAVVFMFSVIMNSLLIIMAPIFIVTILFEKTKSLFDSWAKNLISFALQPMFVFLTIIIMNFIVMMLLYYIFNFTACSICLVQVDLGPLYNECWVPGYQSIMNTHTPPSNGDMSIYSAFSVYAMSFVGGLVIFMVSFGMIELSSTMADIASWIVTGSAMRHTSAGSMAKNAGKYVLLSAKDAMTTVASAGSNMAGKVASKMGKGGGGDKKPR